MEQSHKRLPLLIAVFLGFLCTVSSRSFAQAAATREQILQQGERIADAQLRVLGDKLMIDWTWGVMAAGYSDFSRVAPKGAEYERFLTSIADKAHWAPRPHREMPYHADDFCITQSFLDLYAAHPDPAHLAPIEQRMNVLVEHLTSPAAAAATHPTFDWCDALFMAPPAMAHMSEITKDPKYLNAMDAEFWRTTALLYDGQDHLFYRDAKFINKKDANGIKIFWSRGNAWVLGGLARVLQYMPADYPSRGKYVQLFDDMSARLITLQGSDGTWRTNLKDPAEFPGSETSGTALFTYAMAWGINNHLLDRDTYLPVVEKAWAAMLAARRSDGLPGFAQGVGYMPGIARSDNTALYVTGAYLLAATELQKLAPLTLPQITLVQPIYADAADDKAPTTASVQPAPGAKAFARYVPERMDDIAWENDRIAHRIYGPALQHNPKEHSGSGIDVWVKSVREPVINEWYKSGHYHVDRGTGLDFYEVGTSRGDGGLGIWDDGKLFNSKDWVDHTILDLGPDECGFTITYAPWDANGRKVWEQRKMTLNAGSNLTRIESTIDSDKPGDIIVGIGLCSQRPGNGGHLLQDKELGVMSFWQPPEKDGTIAVGVVVDPKSIVEFNHDSKNYLVLVKETAGKPFVYYAGACWDRGLDFHTSDQWETYLKEFKRE